MKSKKLISICFAFLAGMGVSTAALSDSSSFSPSPYLLKVNIDSRSPARTVTAWFDLVAKQSDKSETEQVSKVNNFFNRLTYIPDAEGREANRWSTPTETLKRSGGDCEDLAIAKYYTLRALGIPQSRLRLSHVRSPGRGLDHMVVVYEDEGNNELLVLDNLTDFIGSLETRTDLIPVYSFNHQGLWIGADASDKRLDPNQISKWRELRKSLKGSNALHKTII